MATTRETTLIRDMLADERPRERAIRSGIKSLSDVELMAIIFSTGMKGKSVIDLSREIIADNGGHISSVARMSVNDMLRRYKGIGKAKAVTLLAALELGTRAAADDMVVNRPAVTDAAIAAGIMRPHMEHLNHEEFWAMLLSQSGKVIRCERIGSGGISSTAVDVRLIIKAAIEHLASALIIFHNHPSGNLNPSMADENLTRKTADACRLLDIKLNDHIILTDNSYYSFHDNGKL